MAPINYHIVELQAQDCSQHSVAHVIVYQNENRIETAVMVALFDQAFPYGCAKQVVEVVPKDATDMDLVAAVGRWQQCKHGVKPEPCTCLSRGRALPKHPALFPTEMGQQFVVLVQTPRMQSEGDEQVFLQTFPGKSQASQDAPMLDEDSQTCQDKELGFMLQNMCCREQVEATGIGTTRPIPLCLEAVIPKDSKQLDSEQDVSFQWFEKRNWNHDCVTNCHVKLQPLHEGLRIKKPSYYALTANTNLNPDTCQWMLFVDGAANDVAAAWSVIVVATDGSQQQFIGCTYGQIECDDRHESWLGADQPNNIAAEFAAVMIAQNLVLQWNDNSEYWICPDLQLSQHFAQAKVAPKVQATQTKAIRIQAEWIEDRCKYHHVKGHAGFAWNELADSVAGHALKHNLQAPDQNVQPMQNLLRANEDLEWVWMQDSTDPLRHCFPPLIDEQAAVVEPSLCRTISAPSKTERPP